MANPVNNEWVNISSPDDEWETISSPDDEWEAVSPVQPTAEKPKTRGKVYPLPSRFGTWPEGKRPEMIPRKSFIQEASEEQTAAVAGRKPRSRIAESGAALARGFLNLGETAVATSQKWSPLFGEKFGVTGLLKKVGYEKPVEMVEEAEQKIVSAKAKIPRTREGAGGWAINVLGEGAPYLMTSMASGGAMGWLGSALTGFSMGGEQAYKAAKAKGASETTAMRDYALNGLTEAALQAWSVGKLLNFKSAGKSSLKLFAKNVSKRLWKKAAGNLANITGNMLKGALVEGFEEANQSGASLAVAALPGGGDIPRKPNGKPDWWAMVTQIGEEGLGGALLGAVVPSGMGAVEVGAARAEGITPARKQAAIDAVKNSNLNEVMKTRMLVMLDKKGEVQNNPDVSPKSLEVVDKLAGELAKLEPKRKQFEKEMDSRKAKMFAKQRKVLNDLSAKGLDQETISKMSQGAGKGFLKSLVPEIAEHFSKEDVNTIRQLINEDKRIDEAQWNKLNNVMKAVFTDKVQPSKSEIKAFDEFFGTNIIEAGKRYAPKWQKALRFAWDATTKVPRAFVCSVDHSVAGIQAGLVTAAKHPLIFSRDIAQGLKMLVSEDYANVINTEIQTNPLYEQAVRDNLAVKGGSEEYFQSDIAHRVPFMGWLVRASDRAFSTTARKLRMDYYNRDMEVNQDKLNDTKWRKQIADHINNITGSGKIPGRNTKIGKFINEAATATLWAPKLYVGTAKTWTDMITKSAIRRTAAVDLVKGIGLGVGILALVKWLFGDKVEIELNPQSSDFAKIKYKNTRINFFGQHQQMARLVAQLATGKTKSTATGRISDIKRFDIVKKYLQFKLNPAISVPVDIATGKTAMGEKMRYEPEFAAGYTAEHLVPLFLQDMADAVRFQGWKTALSLAPLAFHGVGMQTYEKNARSELSDLQNHYAHEAWGVDWDKLGSEYQQAIADARPILEEYRRKAAIEAENFDYESRMQAEQREMGRRIRKALPKKVQQTFEALGVSTTISKKIRSDWYLNDERYAAYREGVIKLLKDNALKAINQPDWNTLHKQVQYDYLQGMVDAARDHVRGEIVAKANYEDYQRVQIGELPE